ncbi:enoyl-CoA hydratase [Herbaspirillum sp.]|uniref:enoyl-CoA hydratase n=1 Tax=Herbaspirillum sp. TaxID=1890675 RepID=UPI0031DDB189
MSAANGTDTSQPILLREDKAGIATLTLNRPQQFNALSEAMLDALQAQLDRLAADDSVRCVVLAASGRAFCAGHDLREMRATPQLGYYQELFQRCSRVMQAIQALPMPVIARVHGIATAAGCQLVGSCDLAVASHAARFAVSGINVGLFCATPSVALTRNIPIKRAFEMLVTGKFIDAQTAADWGLINHAVAEEELDAAVATLAAQIVAKSPVSIRYGKAMVYRQKQMALSDAYEYAADVMARNIMEDDAMEGIDAFLEKRTPKWGPPA